MGPALPSEHQFGGTPSNAAFNQHRFWKTPAEHGSGARTNDFNRVSQKVSPTKEHRAGNRTAKHRDAASQKGIRFDAAERIVFEAEHLDRAEQAGYSVHNMNSGFE